MLLQDDTFGVNLYFPTRVADFSILLEESIFVIFPGLILCLVALPRLVLSFRNRKQLAAGSTEKVYTTKPTIAAKIILHALNVLLGVAFPVSLSLTKAPLTRCTHAAAAVSLVGALLCVCLSFRARSRPCSLLLLYICTCVAADSVRMRTLWSARAQYHVLLPALLGASLAIQLALLCVEAQRRGADCQDDVSPQDLCSVFSQRFFFWLNPLVWQGLRQSLAPGDLFPLDRQLKQERLMQLLHGRFATAPSLDFRLHINNGKPCSVPRLLLGTLGRAYAAPVIPRLLQIAFVVAQPLLLRTLSDFLSKDPADRTAPAGLGLPIITAYVVVYVGIAISNGWYWTWVDRSIISTRGLLIGAILEKVLLLDLDRASDRGRVVTLVSGDVEKAIAGLESCHELWANTLQAAIALWLLYAELGVLFVAPLAVAAVAGTASLLTARAARGRQAPCMAAMENRVDETVAMCRGIWPLRTMGLFGAAVERIQGWRRKELSLLKHYRWMTIVAIVISPAIVFTVLNATDKAVMGDVSRVFAVLGLLALLCEPLIYLYQLAPYLAFTFVCLGRVGEFFSTSSLRINSQPRSDASKESNGSKDLGLQLEVRNARFGWETQTDADASSVAISVRGLKLHQGQLLVVTGPARSGKSTLLLEILGETRQGETDVLCIDDPTSAALCAQDPWLPEEESVRDAIVAGCVLDSAWLDTVASACCCAGSVLGVTQRLPEAQKRLVALARAVYSRRRLLLLDEPFLGMEESLASQVRANLFGAHGLLRLTGCTVVITSSTDGFLESEADLSLSLSASSPSSSSLGTQSAPFSEPDSGFQLPSKQQLVDSSSTIAEEEAESHSAMLEMGEWALGKYYFQAAGLHWLAPFALTAAGFSLMHGFTGIVLRWWSGHEHSTPDDLAGSRAFMGQYWALSSSALVSLGLCTWVLLQRCVPVAGARLHRGLLDAMAVAPIGVLTTGETGSIVNRFSQDFLIIDGEMTRHLSNFAQESVTAITQLGLVVAANRFFIIAFVSTALVVWLVQHLYLSTARQLRLLELSSRASLASHLLAALSGLATLRNMPCAAQQARALAVVEATQRPTYLAFCLRRWLSLVLDLCVAVLATAVATTAVSMRGRGTDSGFVAVALINLMGLGSSLRALVTAWSDLGTAMGSLARVKHVREALWVPRLGAAGDGAVGDADLSLQSANAVEFRNVTASYLPGGPAVLKGFSLVVQPGEKILIRGPSGSGKTSALLALMGMLCVDQGSIRIGGEHIGAKPHNICNRIGYIPPDKVVLPGWTVKDYLDPSKSLSDSIIIDRLRQQGIWAELQDMSGLDTRLDSRLTRRQLRRLALVASLLKSVQVLLVDEAPNLDDEEDFNMFLFSCPEFDGLTILHAARMDRARFFGGRKVLL